MPDSETTFSNPMAPTHMYRGDDTHPLTNDDFRKLMMTPRVPREGMTSSHGSAAPSSRMKAPAETSLPSRHHSISSDGDPADENDAGTLRKKRKSYYAQLRKEEDEREKELAKRYRDRARERRDGVNKEGGGGEEPNKGELASTTADYRAVAPDAKIPEDYAERRRKVIQESKYLGGDMEHTHLVKGLDYALLEKVKAEITNKEKEEEEMEQALQSKPREREEEQTNEEGIQFRTRLARNVCKVLFRPPVVERNELFLPHRMAYVVDLEDEFGEFDIPTTLIRSKADCPSLESTTTLSNNDIVINKLTQILCYLRQGKRDRKKKKGKAGAVLSNEERMKALSMDIYGSLGGDSKSSKDSRRAPVESSRHKPDHKRSYFEKPIEEERGDLPKNANELVMSINSRFGGGAWNIGEDNVGGAPEKKSSREDERMKKLKKKQEIDSYAECYPGMMESADALDDSDDEADYTKMDQGNKKGPVGRWDFDTQEEYSTYMSAREALPKAAFQYGVKMSDGRKTRRAGVKDEKKELDKEWQQIQSIIKKRRGDDSGGPAAKRN